MEAHDRMSVHLPETVVLHEVVLRDGIQNEEKIISTADKIELVEKLVRCGIRRIEVSSFVNPRLVPQMADAEELWAKIDRRKGVVLSALILGRKSLDRAINCKVPHVGIFVSASETHSRKNSNRSIADATDEAVALTTRAKEAGMEVRAGVMNAFGCAYEGNVPVDRVLALVADYIKTEPDEICLADTSGMANPKQIRDILIRLRDITGDKPVSLHLHNTRGLGLANVWEALQQGVAIFDTSMGGLGGCPFIPEAKGNIATEDTVHMLHEMGLETNVDLDCLIETSLGFEALMGREFPAMVSHLPASASCDP